MKALRLALLALLLAVPALAAPTGKLLFVEQTPNLSGGQMNTPGLRRVNRITKSILNRLGVNYSVITPRQTKTEWGKTGLVGWQYGKVTAGQGTYNEQFDAVLWSATHINGLVTSPGPRPDSLLNSGRVYAGSGSGLAVPNLFLFSDEWLEAGGTMSAACCTTGVEDMNSGDLYIYGLQHRPGSLNGWYTTGLFQRDVSKRAAKISAGGFRPLLVANQPSMYMYDINRDCGWCDSIPFAASGVSTKDDSVLVWSLPFSNIAGSKPIICAYVDGNGQGDDSISIASGADVAEVDPGVILYAICALDSASGHKLIDRSKLPLKLGLTIEAAGCYTSNRAGPGILPSDSTVLSASIDSLAALNARGGVKLYPTIGINVAGLPAAHDSLATTGAYSAAWLNRWRSIAGAKFTPQVWAGTLSEYRRASTGLGDVFGFNRSRTFLGDGAGDGDGAQKDTSLTRLLNWSKLAMLNAGIDRNEMSRTLIAPMLDWAPANKNDAVSRDSAFQSFDAAGFTTVISDANLSQSNPGTFNGVSMASATYRGVSNGFMGYTSNQGTYRTTSGHPFMVLASNGHDITGGTSQVIVNDSSNATGSINVILQTIYRTVSGLLVDNDHWNCDYMGAGPTTFFGNYYTVQKDQNIAHTLIYQGNDVRFSPRPGNILRLTAADFSGTAGGSARGAPARNGWWIVKSLKNWMDDCNNAYGGTVVTFDYPENINPYR